MKIYKALAIVAAAIVTVSACKKPGGRGGDSDSLVGTWHLTEWVGDELPDVYLSFGSNGSFEMYQRAYSPYYEYYSGSWSFSGETLSGTYDNGSPWRSSYNVVVEGDVMTLTDVSQSEDVSRYVRASIPEEITSGDLTKAVTSVPIL